MRTISKILVSALFLTLHSYLNVAMAEAQGVDTLEEERTIFSDDASQIWGLEKDRCKDVRVEKSNVFLGESALRLDWNKIECDWMGFGIRWDDQPAINLESNLEEGAIVFQMRSTTGEAFIPTMIFILEDGNGKGTAAVVNSNCLTSYPINEEWQECRVPLNSFPFAANGVDHRNITQFVVELLGEGHIIIDEIEIQSSSSPTRQEHANQASTMVPNSFPIEVYKDEFENAWGFASDRCRTFETQGRETNRSWLAIAMLWNLSDGCYFDEWGVSWSNWVAVDLSEYWEVLTLEMDVKVMAGFKEEIPLVIGFEDYNESRASTHLTSDFVSGGNFTTEWKHVEIPLSEFKLEKSAFQKDRIKQLVFRVEEQGSLYIDDIHISKKGNP